MWHNRQALWNLGISNKTHGFSIVFASLLTANLLHIYVLPFGFGWLVGAGLFAILAMLSRRYTRQKV